MSFFWGLPISSTYKNFEQVACDGFSSLYHSIYNRLPKDTYFFNTTQKKSPFRKALQLVEKIPGKVKSFFQGLQGLFSPGKSQIEKLNHSSGEDLAHFSKIQNLESQLAEKKECIRTLEAELAEKNKVETELAAKNKKNLNRKRWESETEKRRQHLGVLGRPLNGISDDLLLSQNKQARINQFKTAEDVARNTPAPKLDDLKKAFSKPPETEVNREMETLNQQIEDLIRELQSNPSENSIKSSTELGISGFMSGQKSGHTPPVEAAQLKQWESILSGGKEHDPVREVEALLTENPALLYKSLDDMEGYTLLNRASMEGWLDTVKLLLERESELETKLSEKLNEALLRDKDVFFDVYPHTPLETAELGKSHFLALQKEGKTGLSPDQQREKLESYNAIIDLFRQREQENGLGKSEFSKINKINEEILEESEDEFFDAESEQDWLPEPVNDQDVQVGIAGASNAQSKSTPSTCAQSTGLSGVLKYTRKLPIQLASFFPLQLR